MQDDCLWQAHSTPRGGGVHVYRMVNAHSSQQYVEITGNLVRPGTQGVPPWFRTTVPSVDVDWSEHSGHGDEADEDSWIGLCPVTTNRNEMTRLIVCRPNEDLSLVSGDMVLECEPTTRVRFLRESGSGILWSGATVNYSMTPLSLLVDPQQPGDFSVTLKGQTDEKNKRPTDYLKGRAVVVDLDVDVDGNGTITAADDPSEETIGGYVGVSTNNLTPIKLKLQPTTGTDWKLRLLAPEGSSHIRVWTTTNRTGAVSLPKTWAPGDTIPSTLYVEGITTSSAARDVALRLEYDLNPVGQNAENRKLADIIRLTVLDIELRESRSCVNEGGYVYIDETPLMPQLSASVMPQGLSGMAEWKLHIEYRRPDRGDYTGDVQDYPTAANVWQSLSLASSWNIAERFGNDFRGGKAVLHCRYNGVQISRIFHIRGTNPTEAAARAYLDEHGQWFAYCIAKHESGRQNGRTYLQFNERGTLGPEPEAYCRCPNRGPGNLYGWGMMQLDGIELPGQVGYRNPDNGDPWAQELWSWKANCDTAIQVIDRKRELARNHLRNIAPANNANGYVMPSDLTVSGVAFTSTGPHHPDDLEVIKRYNGGIFWTLYNDQTGEWSHVSTGGTELDYTEKVLNEY